MLCKPNISYLEKIIIDRTHQDLKENKNHILRNRYHLDYPLSVKNPLTNQIIVGEVEFYLLKYKLLDSTFEQIKSNKCASDIILKAIFIGTDYTYAYS